MGENGHRKPPPVAGAVDLNRLRVPKVTQEALEEATQQMLARQGFVCPCGERITNDGVEYLALLTQALPDGTPTVGLGATTFHSRDCELLVQLLAAESSPNSPQPLIVRPVAPIEWLDEPSTTEKE